MGSRSLVALWARNRLGVLGLVLLVFFLLMATVGPRVVPPAQYANVSQIYAPPSWAHPLGTDYAGRDVLDQIIHGSQFVLAVAALIGLFTAVLGTTVGLVAGYAGGVVDTLLMRLTDVVLTIPQYPLLLIMATVLKLTSPVLVAGAIAITSWGGLARSVRSMVLSLKEKEFILAARSLDMGPLHIMAKEVFPNLAPFVLMNLLYAITGGVYAQVGLFVLGVLPFSTENWGNMINLALNQSGALFSSKSWLYLFSPLAAILLLQAAILLFVNSLDVVFNPRLRTRG